jgi:hypothetical protein
MPVHPCVARVTDADKHAATLAALRASPHASKPIKWVSEAWLFDAKSLAAVKTALGR